MVPPGNPDKHPLYFFELILPQTPMPIAMNSSTRANSVKSSPSQKLRIKLAIWYMTKQITTMLAITAVTIRIWRLKCHIKKIDIINIPIKKAKPKIVAIKSIIFFPPNDTFCLSRLCTAEDLGLNNLKLLILYHF